MADLKKNRGKGGSPDKDHTEIRKGKETGIRGLLEEWKNKIKAKRLKE